MKSKYKLLEEWMVEQITLGNFKPNDLLPTEDKMQRQFNLSKMTVRKAIQNLKQRNFIFSIPGKGFMVSPFVQAYISQDALINKKITLPTKVKLPNYLINDVKHCIDLRDKKQEDWFPFIIMSFSNDNVVEYEINWYYQEKNKIDLLKNYKDYKLIEEKFNEDISIKTIKIFVLEEIIKNDINIFGEDQLEKGTKFIPVRYQYSISKKGKINKVTMTRFLPTKFELVM